MSGEEMSPIIKIKETKALNKNYIVLVGTVQPPKIGVTAVFCL